MFDGFIDDFIGGFCNELRTGRGPGEADGLAEGVGEEDGAAEVVQPPLLPGP
jgi:hypothetical protein